VAAGVELGPHDLDDIFDRLAAYLERGLGAELGLPLRAGVQGAGTFGDRIIGELAGDRRAAMARELVADAPAGCAFDQILVSYDAAILRHVKFEKALWSRTFKSWKEGVRSLHLAQARCPNRVGLFLLDAYEPAQPLIIGWRFITPEQWVRLEPKL